MFMMTSLRDWIKRVFDSISPSQEGNAWDEYKRYRQMEEKAKS